jgi:hypothetical protein
MSFGPVVVYSTSIVSGTSTAYFNLDKAWGKKQAFIGSLSTNAELTIYGSPDGSTWKVVFERVNTAPVQYQTLTVASSANNKMVPIDVGAQYIAFAASATVTDGASIKMICSDY